MDENVLAAVRRFPEWKRTIIALVAWDDDFRQLCADLADAEAALNTWEGSSSPARERRCAEYRILINDLVIEIGGVLKKRARD
jgi:uncharacterized membrane protein YidH (DUF202 family)